MLEEINHLEQRLQELARAMQHIRQENQDLRLKVAQTESETRRLNEKLNIAQERVQLMLTRVSENLSPPDQDA